MMEFEKVFPELCTIGKYQKLIFFLVLLPAQLSYYGHIFDHLLVTYQPQHWCTIDQPFKNSIDSEASTSTMIPAEKQAKSISVQTKTANNRNLHDSSNTTYNELAMSMPALQLGQSLRNNDYLQRFLYLPSRHILADSVKSDNAQLINMSQLLVQINFSLSSYLNSLSSCHMYSGQHDRLVQFQKRFLYLFSVFSSNASADNHISDTSESQAINRFAIQSKDQHLLRSPLIVACTSWTYNQSWLGADHSIVTKWNLFCHREWLQLVPLSSLMLGLFSGYPLHCLLTDSFGQRKTYFISLLCQCVFGTLSAFIEDFKHFCLVRFVIGLTLASIVTVPTDLMVELAGVRVMSYIVFYQESTRLFGALLLVLVGYFIHDYRHLLLTISLPFLVFFFFWWSFPESCKYLLVSSQVTRLEKFLLDIAHTNLSFVDPEFDNSLKRRIYIELAIYREFLISSLMHCSFPKCNKYLSSDSNFSGIKDANSIMMTDIKVAKVEPNKRVNENSLVNTLTQHLVQNGPHFDSLSSSRSKKDCLGTTATESWSDHENGLEKRMANGKISSGRENFTSPDSSTSDSSNSPDSTPTSSYMNRISSKTHLDNRTTLTSILRLPNMRRKFIAMLLLSATHFPLYIATNYFILDFVGIDHNQSNTVAHTLHHYLAFAIGLNLIGLLLAAVCLNHFQLGRKFSFLMASLLASFFSFLTSLAINIPLDQFFVEPLTSVNHFPNMYLIAYSLCKIFQASSYLIWLVWLYELFPPTADCSIALRTCLTVSHLKLVMMPLLLYASQKSLKVPIHVPDLMADIFRKSTSGSVNLSIHYLFCTVLLGLSALVCLVLPETGSLAKLPYTLQEAEHFGTFDAYEQNGSAPSAHKWYSCRVLFNFRPPNVRPSSGILKKPSTISRVNGKFGKKFLFDSTVNEKLANMNADYASRTAFNSMHNRFLSIRNDLPERFAYEQANQHNANGRNKSAWMSAAADAVASGVPLFVPADDASALLHANTTSKPHITNLSLQNVAIDDMQHHMPGYNENLLFSHKNTSSGLAKWAVGTHHHHHSASLGRRYSLHHSLPPSAGIHLHSVEGPQQEFYLSQPSQQNNSSSSNNTREDAFRSNSQTDISYMHMTDLPYQQHCYQSLPQVSSMKPVENWLGLLNPEDVQQWLLTANKGDSLLDQQSASVAIGNSTTKGKVHVVDIMDSKQQTFSGQVDTYPESTHAGYFSNQPHNLLDEHSIVTSSALTLDDEATVQLGHSHDICKELTCFDMDASNTFLVDI